MSSNGQKRILIAPLDWGLGHTTRCVPIIQWLKKNHVWPIFAGNEWQKQYITKTLGHIETIHLEGYNVTYSKSKSGFIFSLLYQMPGLVRTIHREHEWLQKTVVDQQFDGIISDNRYGLFHKRIPSVLLTHQLLAQTSLGNKADNLLRSFHYRYINRFHECWIVDVPGQPNLSGKLAHPEVMPDRFHYIGLLSQFAGVSEEGREGHLLVLLSGPEPQRSILSDILWKQLAFYRNKIIFVEGSNYVTARSAIPPNISYHTQITKEELAPLLQNASIVVCRSGYSTLMDLVALGKRAVIIPTPGQTEQEYLAKYLHKAGIFFYVPQKKIDLPRSLNDAQHFPFKKIAIENAFNQYQPVLQDWLRNL